MMPRISRFPWSNRDDFNNLLRQKAYEMWLQLPDHQRAWFEVFGVVPYEAILDIDEHGDEMFKGPQIYTVEFDLGNGPFIQYHDRIKSCEEWQPNLIYPDSEKRVSWFRRNPRSRKEQMACEIKDPICTFFYDWQTLIAGIMALIAGFGTIWVTRDAAKKTIKAANDTADREIAAAQEQIKVAQRQIDTSLDMERRRTMQEGRAFLEMLVSAMQIVIDDVAIAKALDVPDNAVSSQNAYSARQQIKKTAFTDLRRACLRNSSDLTGKFLSLDNLIDGLASKCSKGQSTGGMELWLGNNKGLGDELSAIEKAAAEILKDARAGIEWHKRWLVDPEE